MPSKAASCVAFRGIASEQTRLDRLVSACQLDLCEAAGAHAAVGQHCLNNQSCRLRDSHVDWRNGGTKDPNGFRSSDCRMLLIIAQVDSILNQFIFMLQDDRAQKAVRIQALCGERGLSCWGNFSAHVAEVQFGLAKPQTLVQVAARDTVVVNGFAAPRLGSWPVMAIRLYDTVLTSRSHQTLRFLSEGGEIASIDGLQPMR